MEIDNTTHILLNQKYVIFDLDGTIINSFDCVLRCINKSLQILNFPLIYIEDKNIQNIDQLFFEARILIKNSVKYDIFRNLFDSLHYEDCMESIELNMKALPIINKLLNDNYKIVIITNKLERIACKICNNLLPHIPLFIIGRLDVNTIKSDASKIIHRLTVAGFKLSNCLCYFGDSETDQNLADSLSLKYIDINKTTL